MADMCIIHCICCTLLLSNLHWVVSSYRNKDTRDSSGQPQARFITVLLDLSLFLLRFNPFPFRFLLRATASQCSTGTQPSSLQPTTFWHASRTSSASLSFTFSSIVLRTSSGSNTIGHGTPPPVSDSHCSIASISATFSARVPPSHGSLAWRKRRRRPSVAKGSVNAAQ